MVIHNNQGNSYYYISKVLERLEGRGTLLRGLEGWCKITGTLGDDPSVAVDVSFAIASISPDRLPAS